MPPAFLVDGPTETFPYRVDRAAGEGAMGVVYRAMDVVLERPVAIKVLKSDEEAQDNAEEQRRFLQEARAAAALSHPGVTTLHRIARNEGVPYIVMEWLEGPTLAQLVQSEGPLPLDRAGHLMIQLLDVLDAAHRAGVVHRDIKPSNLIAVDGDRLKVTDFGIALLQGRQLVRTVAGSVLATPQFASPEQVNGAPVDGRSDLFSAALVFYHLLTNQAPFEGRSLQEMLAALLTRPAVSIRVRNPGLPEMLDPWFERALAKDPDDRFGNAADMKRSLQEAIETPTTGRRRTGGSRTAPMMVAPASIVVTSADSLWGAVQELIQSWEARPLGRLERDAFLDKLLDQPLHAAAFAGAADFGGCRLLVEQGTLLAILDPTGRIDPEASLPAEGEVTLYPVPDFHQDGFVGLLATALAPGAARHEDLDSLVVDLAALGARLQQEKYEGVIRLGDQTRTAAMLLQKGRAELALLTAGWPGDPKKTNWPTWLDSVTANASVFDRTSTPPTIWYRRAFRELELQVARVAGGEQSALSKILVPEQPAEGELMSVGGPTAGRETVGATTLASSPMRRFLDWMFGELPQLLVDRGKSDSLKYLSDWLLLVRKARLYSRVERPGAGVRDDFDLVTEDADGKILHLAMRIPDLDAATFKQTVDQVVAAKRARKKRGDIGGVFLICRKITEPLVEAYRTLLHQGFGNRFLGMDKSLGYEGFVRLGAGRGFHLMLVEERDDGFHPRFVRSS